MDRDCRVTRVQPGDRVIVSITPVCGTCWHCLRQETHLCDLNAEMLPRLRATRADGTQANALAGIGSFADVITVDEASCIPVHTDLPADQLSLIGCGFTTGFGAAVNTAEVRPGATVAVIGAGGVGTATILGAQVAGAARIIAVDPVAMKRESALRFGATDVVDPSAGDPIEQVKALTDGRGVDYAFEAVGSHALELQALDMTRRGGTTVFIGVPGFRDTLPLPSMQLIMEDRTVKGSYYGSARVTRDFPRFIELIESGRLDVASMITRQYALDDVTTPSRRCATARSSAASSSRLISSRLLAAQGIRVHPVFTSLWFRFRVLVRNLSSAAGPRGVPASRTPRVAKRLRAPLTTRSGVALVDLGRRR